MDFDLGILDRILSLDFIFALLMLVIWIGYLFFAVALVGKTRVLAKTLKTGLSAINVLVAWVHLAIVIFAGVIAIFLIIL